MSIQTVEPEIMRICQSIPGIAIVYDYDRKRIEKLPAISFQYSGFDQQMRSHVGTNVAYRWTIRLYVTAKDEKATHDQLKVFTEAILDAFNADLDLGGKAFTSLLTSGELLSFEDNDGAYLLHTFTLEATVPKSITP